MRFVDQNEDRFPDDYPPHCYPLYVANFTWGFRYKNRLGRSKITTKVVW